MSLILEALRKSEERRRLGEAPTLISQSEWAARRHPGATPRSRAWMWLVAPVLVAGLAGGWWWFVREPATAPAAQTPPTAVESAASAAAPGSDAGSAPDPATAARGQPLAAPQTSAPPSFAVPNPPQAPDSVPGAGDPVPPDLRGKFERGEVFANSPDQLRPPVPTPEAPIVPPDAALPQPLPEPAELATAAAPAPTIATAPSTPTPVTPAPTASAAPAVAQTPPAATTGALLYAYELPLAVRQALPPLKLAMHVYAVDPAQRFVLLDGERLTEGAASGDLRAVEIRADGVVLEFRGSRFLLPRHGG